MTISIVRVTPADCDALYRLFADFLASGVDRDFHPHPFTFNQARTISSLSGKDLYLLLKVGDQPAGYGFLRGWDQGYTVPSLGIGIASDLRGRGLGELLMRHLHASAWMIGAPRVRLKVYTRNTGARSLYLKLGYGLSPHAEGEEIGILERPRIH